MKRNYLSILFIFFQYIFLFGVNNSSDSLVLAWAKDDPTLSKILSVLPSNWHFELDKPYLKIYCEDSLYCKNKNIESDSLESVITDKVQVFILLKFEPIWSIEKILSAKQNNERVNKEIIELQHKYNKKIIMESKNQAYKPTTYLDSVYYQKLKIINNKYIELPNFNTIKYSWFFVDECCTTHEIYDYHPMELMIQMLNIKNLFRELGGS